MNLGFILCALAAILPSVFTACEFCTNLEIFYREFGCKSSCRRRECITGYDCQSPVSKLGKECMYRNRKYLVGEQLTVQQTPNFQFVYTCKNDGTGDYFDYTQMTHKPGAVDPLTDLLLSFYLGLGDGGYPFIVPSEKYALLIEDKSLLPPSTCTETVHCCIVNDVKYEWNNNIVLVDDSGTIYNCTCRCSPFMECEAI